MQTACGPVGATSLIGDAEIAVTRAHAADGDRHAIYEVTSADLYLEKAKEEQGHAHYGPAMELAKKSAEMAQAATLKAAQVRTGAAPTAPPPSTLTRPEPLPPAARPLITEPPVPAPSQRATTAPIQAPAPVQPAPTRPAAAPQASPALAAPAPAADIAVPQLPAAAPLPTVAPGAALPDIPAGQRPVLIPGAAPKSDGKPEDKPKREKQPIQPENAP